MSHEAISFLPIVIVLLVSVCTNFVLAWKWHEEQALRLKQHAELMKLAQGVLAVPAPEAVRVNYREDEPLAMRPLSSRVYRYREPFAIERARASFGCRDETTTGDRND
jgi:hypothetical protein